MIRNRFENRAAAKQMAWMLATALLFAAPATPARAFASDRPLTLQVGGGLRTFNSQLGLRENASMGLRMGLGVTDRLSFALDYVFSAPPRENTDIIAGVSALRGLARFDILSGNTRPYVIAGVGGVLFNFGDARDYSTGTLTVGYGLSRRLGSHNVISIEASADVYRARTEEFTLTGSLLSSGPRSYQGLGTITAAVGFAL